MTEDATKAPEAISGDTAAQEAAGTTSAPQEAADFDALPAWAKSMIKDLRKEQQQRGKQLREAEAAAQAAQEADLAKRQEWQQLAEARQARIAELEPITSRHEALSAAVTAQAEAEIKQWPTEVQALRPTGADAAGLLEWMQTARPLAQKLAQAAANPAPGQSQTPKPAGQAAADQAKARENFARMVRQF